MAKTRMTSGEFIDTVAEKTGLKRDQARTFLMTVSMFAVDTVKKNGEVKIPYLGRMLIKHYPAKKHPEGDYTNPFTKETVHKKAWTTPAKKKLKFYFASQVKEPVIG